MATIKIGKWQDDLPDGYDVHNDLRKTREIEDYDFNAVKEAIDNAVEFEPELPKTIGAFTVLTGKRASATTPPPTEWLIKGVLPRRFNSVIAGTTGSKKSMYAMQLGMSLANGEKEFCGNKIIP